MRLVLFVYQHCLLKCWHFFYLPTMLNLLNVTSFRKCRKCHDICQLACQFFKCYIFQCYKRVDEMGSQGQFLNPQSETRSSYLTEHILLALLRSYSRARSSGSFTGLIAVKLPAKLYSARTIRFCQNCKPQHF